MSLFDNFVGTREVSDAHRFDTQALTLWLQAHANLRRASIVATYLNGQAAVQFAVVSGPFASLAEANTFAAGSGIPKDPQIRSARSMKDHFAPESNRAP